MSNQEIIEIIDNCIYILENTPCFGVGLDGASQEELDEAVESGRVCYDDATFHNNQQVWLWLYDLRQKLDMEKVSNNQQ